MSHAIECTKGDGYGCGCPKCVCKNRPVKKVYTKEDRDAWMSLAIGHLAPAGTWPCELFRDIWHAKSAEEAVAIAQCARSRFKVLWGAWTEDEKKAMQDHDEK
jgi:hypothetical protein